MALEPPHESTQGFGVANGEVPWRKGQSPLTRPSPALPPSLSRCSTEYRNHWSHPHSTDRETEARTGHGLNLSSMSEPRLEPKLSPSSQSSPTTINNNENLLAELGRGGLVSSGWFGAGLFTPLRLSFWVQNTTSYWEGFAFPT